MNVRRPFEPRAAPARFPLRLLSAMAFVSLTFIGLLGYSLWTAHRDYVGASRVEASFREAGAELLPMSETLSGTVRLYVATGDRRWRAHWEALEEAEHRTVEGLMKLARSLGLELQVESFESTHERLEDLQKEILERAAVEAGALSAAALLNSRRYDTSLRLYASAIANLIEQVIALGRRNAERAAASYRTRMIVGIGVLAMLAVAWAVLLVFGTRQRARRLGAERALREALATQERLVEERTGELNRANSVLRGEVAARARAERGLRERGAALAAEMTRLNAVLENMDQGLSFFDAEGRLVLCNRQFMEINCIAPGAVEEGMAVAAIEHASRCAAPVLPRSALAGVRAGGTPGWREEPIREEATNHAGRIFELRSSPLPGGGWVTIYTDLTERVAAERRFREVVDKVPCVVLAVDHGGRIRLANAQVETQFGYRPEELLGASIERLVPEDVRPRHRGLRSAYVARGKHDIRQLEVRARRKDGSEFPVELGLSAVELPEGRLTLCVAMDVSERKSLLAQLLHAQKLESIGQLAAGIAHEINTPTQYVGDNLRFLEDAFADIRALQAAYASLHQAAREAGAFAEQVEAVERALEDSDWDYLTAEVPSAIAQAEDGVQKVARIVRAMKEFSHPGGDSKELVDLNRVVENTVTVARNEWKYVAELELELDRSLPDVPCLPAEIGQVVLNLVVNAAHAIADTEVAKRGGKGRIVVATGHDGEAVEIRVADTGTGIPAAVRERVFDPFFTTKEVGRGSGQGLAIARNVVVTKHGGTIDFESREGEGTTFRVRLPLATAREEAA